MSFLLVFCFFAALYLLPTIYAGSRSHPDMGAILTINLLLGWTLIGWVVAMAWAAKSIRADQQYR